VLAVSGAAGILGFAVACTSGTSDFEPFSGSDAGPDSPYEGGLGDTGSDVVTSGDGGAPSTALFVQASPSLPDVRLCWAVGAAVTGAVPFPGGGAMPGSNYPGIPLGGGVPLGDVSGLSGGPITLYAIDAENLARLQQGQSTPYTCDQLVCGAGTDLAPPCLRMNADYWPLQPIADSVLTPGANVVALSGCLASALDPGASVARCGATWSAVAGNLHAEVTHLMPAPPLDAGQIAVQVALLSPALAAALGDGGAVVSFGAQDAGKPVATVTSEDDLAPPAPVTLDLGTALTVFGDVGFSVDVAGLAGGHEWMSLIEAQQLVDPTEDPTAFFGQPRTYLVAVLGDPGAPHAFGPAGDAGYDGTGLHLLVLATPAATAPVGDR